MAGWKVNRTSSDRGVGKENQLTGWFWPSPGAQDGVAGLWGKEGEVLQNLPKILLDFLGR